ncbi:MAG: class I SAM-dependent methyltransferase [Desulfocucumaceae bacterium]
MLIKHIKKIKPENVLDVGCGCGSFTVKIAPYCKHITAIDSSQPLIDRCKKENQLPNVDFVRMDAGNIEYPDNSFDLVLERASLHHILEWRAVLDEMTRFSSKDVCIEEPIDDPRNEEKRNTIAAQDLFLELQKEIGYPHYKHHAPEALLEYFTLRGMEYESQIVMSDQSIEFVEYFAQFELFAEKSQRKEYWLERLAGLKNELKGGKLSENDTLFVFAVKPRQI